MFKRGVGVFEVKNLMFRYQINELKWANKYNFFKKTFSAALKVF